jgi:Fic family protein
MVIQYQIPTRWVNYDAMRLLQPLADAKASVLALTGVPYRKAWAEKLQEIQLKQEVAGTSRIEGAEFTESELDEALSDEAIESALSRSQRQARAAVNTYKWIAALPIERPVSSEIILEIHRRIVTGCDDDHCQPGTLRSSGENVIFGAPRHRGVEGGKECAKAFEEFCAALVREFRDHDILVQGLAMHYHIGAMHPFLDGNGRTARALEALMLQRAGLKDALFISLSNYYYDEKIGYLSNMASVRSKNYDLTDFIIFGLNGIRQQCGRLLAEINRNVSKALFRDLAHDLFGTLRTPKKRVIAKRQLAILNYLLEKDEIEINSLFREFKHIYDLKDPYSAYVRDMTALRNLRAISISSKNQKKGLLAAQIRLSWPTEITETEFFQEMKKLPKAKTFDFLQAVAGEAAQVEQIQI